jgi:hypothetical protein
MMHVRSWIILFGALCAAFQTTSAAGIEVYPTDAFSGVLDADGDPGVFVTRANVRYSPLHSVQRF